MSRSADGRGSGETGPAPDPFPPALGMGADPRMAAGLGMAPAPVTSPPPAPASGAAVFGDRLPLAERFAALLGDTGVSHGLVGPREVPILWERHLLNCAVVHEAFPEGAELVDVGSGAGLPGLVLAVARPDLHVHLVEPMLRRTAWLTAAIEELGLTNATVHRGRAEELSGVLSLPFATARAVARIDKLARWTFPLLRGGGTLVALKGARAHEELTAQEAALRRLGMRSATIGRYGDGVLEVPTLTLELTIGPRTPGASPARRASHGRPAGPRRRANRR